MDSIRLFVYFSKKKNLFICRNHGKHFAKYTKKKTATSINFVYALNSKLKTNPQKNVKLMSHFHCLMVIDFFLFE